MTLKVVNLDDCRTGNGKKPPFALGDVVVCNRISPAGSIGLADKPGWWKPHRFDLLPAE